ncbi:MAG: hypothetical protein P1U40_13665 [Coxiellaceae bacterium]|nr:hypothetical protein [Coxiellaceae bacterium]
MTAWLKTGRYLTTNSRLWFYKICTMGVGGNMRAGAELSPLTIDILVDGTSQVINDEADDHPTSVVGKILSERVNTDGASYRLLACDHQTEIPLDAERVVFYHCGLAADKGKFKGHVITMPTGTTTGATNEGQDEMAFITFTAVCDYIDKVKAAHPARTIVLNFAGYSRGAIVIGHLTNEFGKKYHGDEQVRLKRALALDPVAGGSAGCLLANQKKLEEYRLKSGPFPPVETTVWGPVDEINFYCATGVRRAHFQPQTPHGMTTNRGRRVVSFYDETKVTVTNIATSHFDIACTIDSDASHVPFPILILECYLQDNGLPQFGDDQMIGTPMPYRVSMEQIQACLAHHTNLEYREVLSISFFWKLANFAFTGKHYYVTPLLARAILSTEHPILHADYHRSVIMDAIGFLSDLIESEVIKDDLQTVALTVEHPLHRFFVNCYQRSSYYQAAHAVLSENLIDKSADDIDKILLSAAFIKMCIKQVQRLPFSTTKQTLADIAAWHARQYAQTVRTMSENIVSKAVLSHVIKRVVPGGLWLKPVDHTDLRRRRVKAAESPIGAAESKAGM